MSIENDCNEHFEVKVEDEIIHIEENFTFSSGIYQRNIGEVKKENFWGTSSTIESIFEERTDQVLDNRTTKNSKDFEVKVEEEVIEKEANFTFPLVIYNSDEITMKKDISWSTSSEVENVSKAIVEVETDHTPPNETSKSFEKFYQKEEILKREDKTKCLESGKEDISTFCDDNIKLIDYDDRSMGDMEPHLKSIHSKGFKCHLCEFVTNEIINLKKHIAGVHSNLRKHKCHLCDYAATREKHLKEHIDSIHLNLKNHECHLCDFATNIKHNLKMHINVSHLNLREHKCHLCEYAANKKCDLKKHIDGVHTNSRNHKCHLCDYAAITKTKLNRHIDGIHSKLKNHKCHLCDYCTNYRPNLKGHIDVIHKNLRHHNCDFCDYAASTKSNLKKHMAVHGGTTV